MPDLTRLPPQARVWVDPESFATTMLVVFLDTFGTAALQWDPQTIALEIESEWGIDLPRPNYDRLMVAIRLLTTDDFTTSLPDFIQFCNVLSGDLYDPENWDPADSTEIAWGLTEALLLDPPEDDEPFTEEIRAYIGAALDSEGMMRAPDILGIALREPIRLDVQGDYSDDPTMFASIYQFEAGKTEDVNNIVRARIKLLSAQLKAVPLRTGDAKEIISGLLRSAA